jgi:hypothetical protein
VSSSARTSQLAVADPVSSRAARSDRSRRDGHVRHVAASPLLGHVTLGREAAAPSRMQPRAPRWLRDSFWCDGATRLARPDRLLSGPGAGSPASALSTARPQEQASTLPPTPLLCGTHAAADWTGRRTSASPRAKRKRCATSSSLLPGTNSERVGRPIDQARSGRRLRDCGSATGAAADDRSSSRAGATNGAVPCVR